MGSSHDPELRLELDDDIFSIVSLKVTQTINGATRRLIPKREAS